MPRIKIHAINFIDEHISILFDHHWFQEDITELRQQLLNKIKNHDMNEIVQGADRESCRFTWLNACFILHFDYYSQSCWFTAHDVMSVEVMQPLFNQLSENQHVYI